ncbi:MAG: acyl-CoA dehydrogenase family protein [Aromatoleum sp.]|jgi:alkylation response protein AidB-like acyl-CoA dehydrogenase|uniref:acyl-CoA dehydrogenase family protein n=1 Tax=Aromatoleum sp. TaxID=2307007 RepID=UPI0028948756|nr:acyl-CoA dehydrogenase family protein [Aromatoleum sp.]MDT3670170.1 acyl-CoA dehydrogenase family protein [Aromatoleum sp.]
MVPRNIFSEEHEQFRDSVRRFIATEITPYHRQWEKDGKVSRDVWLKAGAAGFLCSNVPEEFGGVGADFKYNAIFTEELGRAGATGPGFSVHSDMAATYLTNFGSQEQKRKWLPKMASGEVIAAIGLTEPGAGSDLKAISTMAVRDGDDYVINGQKVYISNGQLCDIVILACKTDREAGAKGMTFIIVESDRPGFERGRNLEKLGLKAQDTSELFFSNVRVPVSNRIGEEGQGFSIAMHNLAEERLSIAVSAVGACEGILEYTVAYTKERKVFGQTVADFQNTRFKIAELTAHVQAARVFVDRCIELAVEKKLDSTVAAMAKMIAGELQCKVADECLQFYGGYGYMMEYQIAHAYLDARIRRIAGGSSEVMREIISRKVFA